MSPNQNHRNGILRLLSPAEYTHLTNHLEPVNLSFKESMYEQGQPIEHLYFMTSGVASLVTEVRKGEKIETGTIGREGVVGLPAFLGVPVAAGRAFCQIPGAALRIRADALKAAAESDGSLGPILLRYTYALMTMIAQTAVCNRLHSLEERMCRWLLMTHDRVDSDDFPLTQEFLGTMLGVRRPSVSLAGSALQRAGLIKYSRGRITVVDREGLQDASCDCYAYVKEQFEASLGRLISEDEAQSSNP